MVSTLFLNRKMVDSLQYLSHLVKTLILLALLQKASLLLSLLNTLR
nr:MAG TPA: hypothetical protein [Bacteriophage sp.]